MTSVVSILFKKKTAELSRGYYSRGALIWPPNRSRHNTKPAEASCQIGMGIVQALLAALSGHVELFSWREQGRVGHTHLVSTSSSRDYDFTWDEMDPQLGLFGGFTKGPTYQLAVLHLILCYLDHLHGGSERSAEVMECWFALVEAMGRLYPRRYGWEGAWARPEVAAACGDSEVRPLIEHLADAMWFAMRYHLPALALPREMDLYAEQVWALPLGSPEGTLRGASLFDRPRLAAVTGVQVRRVRQELELTLGDDLLQRLAADRQARMEGSMPVCHFPDPFDDEL